MKAESLIFDIDGTLWDTRQIVARGYNKYLVSIGHPELQVTAEYLTSLFGKTSTEIADIMLASIPERERYDMLRGCMDTEQDVMRADPCQVAFPGVAEGLEELAKTHRLFLVSNAEQGYPELLMDKLNIRHLFRGHLCFGDTGLPKGETIRILMDRHGIDSAVYIGDTQGDLEACRLAGIPFVFCRYGFGTPEEYDAAIDCFADLVDLVK